MKSYRSLKICALAMALGAGAAFAQQDLPVDPPAGLPAGLPPKKDAPEVLPESMYAQKLVVNPHDKSPSLYQVEEQMGIVYADRDGFPCHMNFFRPQVEGTVPCVLYVPGSAFRKQRLDMANEEARQLAAHGIAVAVVEYRGSGTAPFPAQMQDAKTAVRYVRLHADEWGIHPDQLVLMGNSSGGHTVQMAGITAGLGMLDTPALAGTPCTVRGIIDLYGPTDFTVMNKKYSWQDHDAPDSPEGTVLGGVHVLQNPELAERANPLHYISAAEKIPPVLIIHGTKDDTVSILCSDLLADKLHAEGKAFSYYALEGAGHGTPEFRSATVQNLILNFIRDCLQD